VSALPPVVLIHGMGSTFEHNWHETGWVDLLETEGREVVGVELPGHGSESGLKDDQDSAARRLLSVIGDGPVDAIGFSAGAAALYDAMVQRPSGFRRVALLGLTDPLIERRTTGIPELADEFWSAGESSSAMSRLLVQMARGAGNDIARVADYVRRMPPVPYFDEAVAATVPVLVCLGDRETAGADRLVDALPDARLLTLRRADHFATPTNFQCQAAVLDFVSRVGDESC